MRIRKTVTDYFGEPGTFAYFVGRNLEAIQRFIAERKSFEGMEFGECVELTREEVLRIGLAHYDACMAWFESAETGLEAYFLGPTRSKEAAPT